MYDNKITTGDLTIPTCDYKRGGFVQINNLLVEVKVSDDNVGYIVDVFNNDNEELLHTYIITKDQMAIKEEDDDTGRRDGTSVQRVS